MTRHACATHRDYIGGEAGLESPKRRTKVMENVCFQRILKIFGHRVASRCQTRGASLTLTPKKDRNFLYFIELRRSIMV